MRFTSLSFSVLGMALSVATLLAPVHTFAATDSADDQDTDRDEIVVTHKKLGPLSEWARMQADKARYEELKAKFDPDQPGLGAAAQAAEERNAALPPSQREPEIFSEVRNMPTPPAIKAAEDLVNPQ